MVQSGRYAQTAQKGESMKKATGFIACFVLIFIFTILLGCQPTPEKPIVVGQGTDDLEGKLFVDPIAPYSYEAPEEIDDSILMNTCTFYIKSRIEISESQTHPVFRLQQTRFSPNDAEKICSLLVPDISAMRNASVETKEEIQEQILLLEQGIPQYHEDGSITYIHNEQADKVLPDYYDALEKAPAETFEPVNGTIDYTSPLEKVFKRTDGSKARCYVYDHSISVYPDNFGNIQMQSLIVREGGWEGEGPVHLSPTLAADAAQQLGNDLLAELDITNMGLASIEAARMLDGLQGYNTLCTGWMLTYTRDEGLGVPFDSASVSPYCMKFQDDEEYAASWPQETISVFLDENGIQFFNWENPCNIVEEVNANVELLSFEDIYKRATDLIKQGFAWIDEPGTICEDFYITRVLLTNCAVQIKDDIQTSYWIPTWVFVYQHESTLDNSVVPGYIAVNAIDGSRVELCGTAE